MQPDRPLASYRRSFYANSFLRDDHERNHTRLWKVDLVDRFPGLLDNCPLLEDRRPKVRFEKRKSFRGNGREQPVLEMSVGRFPHHQISSRLKGKTGPSAPPRVMPASRSTRSLSRWGSLSPRRASSTMRTAITSRAR